MKPESAKTLVWLAIILIFLGFVGLNPALSLVLFILAAISSAVPALLARKRLRIAGILVCLASVALAVNAYPAYKQHMDQYKAHTQRH